MNGEIYRSVPWYGAWLFGLGVACHLSGNGEKFLYMTGWAFAIALAGGGMLAIADPKVPVTGIVGALGLFALGFGAGPWLLAELIRQDVSNPKSLGIGLFVLLGLVALLYLIRVRHRFIAFRRYRALTTELRRTE